VNRVLLSTVHQHVQWYSYRTTTELCQLLKDQISSYLHSRSQPQAGLQFLRLNAVLKLLQPCSVISVEMLENVELLKVIV